MTATHLRSLSLEAHAVAVRHAQACRFDFARMYARLARRYAKAARA